MRTKTTFATVAALAGLLLAAPLAGALAFGVDAGGVAEMKAAGATPTYGQTWVGKWMKTSGWNGFESDLRSMRDSGVTPVIMWYWFGDAITPNVVYSGKAEWDTYAGEMARRANAVMGGKPMLIVLEPEFNKGGVSDMEDFDGYLAAQAAAIKKAAPSAKIVIGFGHWGGWDRFDRAVAASDFTGFQILRGSTRDSTWLGESVADQMIDIAKKLKARWGKPVVVFDLGVSTWGGWEGVQEKALQRVAAKRGELDAAGVQVIVWRYVRDNRYSSGYFGEAEYYWGVRTSSGANKPAFDDLVGLIKASPPSGGGGGGAPAPAPTGGATFTGVSGNEWWIQANVAGSPQSVTASVNGGAPVALKKQSWGAWAVSTHAPKGSTVTLKATYADGKSASASYQWPSAAPVGSGGGTTPSGFDATFSGVTGNNWWVQADVKANEPLKGVNARVNGGAWKPLAKQSWGAHAWAASFHIPAGSKVELQAVATSGATDTSGVHTW